MRKLLLCSAAAVALAVSPAIAAETTTTTTTNKTAETSTTQPATGQSTTGQSTTGQSTTGQSTTGQAMEAQNRAALECQQEVDSMIEERRDMIAADASRTIRQDLWALREAAFTFARNGDAEACEMVLEEMSDLIERRAEAREAAMKETGASGEVAEVDEEALRKEAMEHYQNSPALSELKHSMAASDLIDADVIGINNDHLGTVEDVILSADGKSVSYVLISHGGFLGMGDELIPVSMEALRVVDRDDLTFLLPVSAEQIDGAPKVERADEGFPEISQWGNDVAQWWNRNIAS